MRSKTKVPYYQGRIDATREIIVSLEKNFYVATKELIEQLEIQVGTDLILRDQDREKDTAASH